jgi:hypothetical protein
MFLPALIFMCRTMHRLARARSGSRVHRADVQSAVAAWLLLPTAFLWCLAPPEVQSSGLRDVLAAMTVAAFAALVLTLALVAFSWARVAREARRWRRGQSPSRSGIDFGLGDNWVRPLAAAAPYRSTEQHEVLAWGSPVVASAALRWNVVALLAVSIAMGTVAWLTLAADRTGCPAHEGCHRFDFQAHGPVM